MYIECLTVSVGYSDFLAWTLPHNKSLFDNFVVVTAPDDERTRRLCEFWHVRCVVSDKCYENGETFNKGKMINEGLAALKGREWVVHMDADIFLPPKFRVVLEQTPLDPEGVHSMDRLMCESFDDWVKYWCAPAISNEADIYVHPRPFPVGVRLAAPHMGGYLPLGYLQLWNQARMRLSYPTEHTDAARGDLQFTMKFPREHRHLIPEMYCIHLETKIPNEGMGSNWGGRRTPPFGPVDLPPVVMFPDRAVEPIFVGD